MIGEIVTKTIDVRLPSPTEIRSLTHSHVPCSSPQLISISPMMVVKVNVISSLKKTQQKLLCEKNGGTILSLDMWALLLTILRESTEKLDKLCNCGISERLSHLVTEVVDHQ